MSCRFPLPSHTAIHIIIIHLADALIQSNLETWQRDPSKNTFISLFWELNPWPWHSAMQLCYRILTYNAASFRQPALSAPHVLMFGTAQTTFSVMKMSKSPTLIFSVWIMMLRPSSSSHKDISKIRLGVTQLYLVCHLKLSLQPSIINNNYNEKSTLRHGVDAMGGMPSVWLVSEAHVNTPIIIGQLQSRTSRAELPWV